MCSKISLRKIFSFVSLLIFTSVFSASAGASVVDYNFTTTDKYGAGAPVDGGMTANDVGETLDAQPNGTSFTDVCGITITVETTSTTTGGTGARFNAVNGGGGVDTLGVANSTTPPVEGGNTLDPTESLSFTFDFGSNVSSFSLVSVDLSGLTGTESATVDINGSATTLSTGVTGFNGTTDVWTLGTPVAFSTGDTMTFTGDGPFRLEGLTFDKVLVVPEPSSVAFLGSLIFGALVRRRR